MAIIAPSVERVGSRYRFHAGPKWIRPDNRTWRPIRDLVRVALRQDGGYDIAFGGRSLSLVPNQQSDRDALAASVERHEMRARRFGPVLRSEHAPDNLVWRIERQGEVPMVANGYQFGVYDGVPIGVFVDDWFGLLGDGNVLLNDNYLAVQLADAKKRHALIDLDPSFAAGAETGTCFKMNEATWDAARTSPADIHMHSTCSVAAYYDGEEDDFDCLRAFVRFDTSSLGAGFEVGAARLKVTPESAQGEHNGVDFYFIADFGALDTADFGAALGDALGSVSDSEWGSNIDTELTLAVPSGALSNINTTGHTCIEARHENDTDEAADPDTMDTSAFYDAAEDDNPVLEVDENTASMQRRRVGFGT